MKILLAQFCESIGNSTLRQAAWIGFLIALSGFSCFGQLGSRTIDAKLVKLEFRDPTKPNLEEIVGEHVLKTVSIDLGRSDRVDAKLTGHDFSLPIDVKIEQFRWEHEKGDIVRLILDKPLNPGLSVTVLAIDSDGKILTLMDPKRVRFGDEAQVSLPVISEKETVRYVVAVMDTSFELSFSEGMSVGRGAKQIAGAAMMTNLGAVYEARGEFEKSIEFYELFALILKGRAKPMDEAAAFNNLGLLHFKFSRYDLAIDYYKRALESLAKVPATIDNGKKKEAGEASTLNNIGQAYNALARFELATSYLQKSLDIKIRLNDKAGQIVVLNNLGAVNNLPGRYGEAIKYYDRSLKLARQLRDTKGEAVALNNLASAKRALGSFAEAETLLNESLRLTTLTGNPNNRAFALNNMGLLNMGRGRFAEAAENYSIALQLYRSLGNRAAESVALNNLMFVMERLSANRMAIFYGKQSVNLIQELRSEIAKLDQETQKSFLASRVDTYRKLSDLLIADGRLTEAQSVLTMLKEEEIFDYARRDPTEIGKLTKRADLREDEKAALAKYDQIAGKIGEIGSEFGKLRDLKNKLTEGASLSVENQKRFDELTKQLEEANKVFQVFLRELADEFAKKPKVIGVIEENAGLQADLKSWGEGVVSLHTIVGDDRYRVILTTSEVLTDGKTEIKSEDLNKKIFEFRAAIQNPNADPRPLGKELYDVIVKPVERQLEGAKAKTLLWSLDGSLRYVPIAALWDGHQYFGQKYQNVSITLASRTRLSEEPIGEWRVLGLGVTAAKEVTEPNGTRKLKFSALPSVGTELGSIIRDENNASETGLLAGKRLLNADFTEQALKDRLGKGYRAVHIASHFSFRPGDMTKSFLLLGDGNTLTMDKVKTSPELKFGGVELLTLSACETAVGEADANGKEIESFAVIAQQNGAKAVMATLWPVADESTSLLMSEFYRLKKENPAMSKSSAIQAAQKAMIDGSLKGTGLGGCRAEVNEPGAPAPFPCKTNAPFSHPYFWAPFVLIGNWR